MTSYPVHGSKSNVFSELLMRASTLSLRGKPASMITTQTRATTENSCKHTVLMRQTPVACNASENSRNCVQTPTQPCWWILCAPLEHVQGLWKRMGRWRTGSRYHWHADSSSPLFALSAGIPPLGSSMGFLEWANKRSKIFHLCGQIRVKYKDSKLVQLLLKVQPSRLCISLEGVDNRNLQQHERYECPWGAGWKPFWLSLTQEFFLNTPTVLTITEHLVEIKPLTGQEINTGTLK